MKKVLFIFLLFISNITNAQPNTTEVSLFAQCMIDINDAEKMKTLETEMRTNPYIKIVRLDFYSKRAFILTKNIDELSEVDYISWFNEYSDNVRCIQIGRHGVDTVKPFPFEGCKN